MSEVVLDASALIAFLKGEPGASSVRPLLPNSTMSAVNLAEVASTFIHGGMPAEEVEAALRELPIRIVSLDDDQAFQAAALRPFTADKGLSLGDRCCLALARSLSLPALTCDKAWAGLPSGVGVDVKLAR
jgi:PIN domain nuclease of toxin-antitoxin system